MANTIIATYENGWLKPSRELPLDEHQQVLVVVVPLTSEGKDKPDAARVASLRAQAEAWLSQQPSNAVREPSALPPQTAQRLDDEFDVALAAIRARASRFSDQQLKADIATALAEARSMPADERARLDAELEQVLAAIITADVIR